VSLAAWPVLLAGLCGCTVSRETVVPVIDVASVNLTLDPEGPWREAGPKTAQGERATLPEIFREPAPEAREPATAPAPRPAPRLEVPVARGLGETTPKGARPAKSLEEAARTRFLDHPTEIAAEQITLYAPPEILAEGQVTAANVSEPTPGRRIAAGGARVALRELTLKAQRITLRARAGSADIQITAQGAVEFVTRQRDQVIREQDLKSLILTNDRITPLR